MDTAARLSDGPPPFAGAWRDYRVDEMAARLIRLVPKMAAQVDLAERGRFDLPINAGSKLRPHRD